ncbi:uncharacterized protein PITG_11634 [Phytophthora infestans T30-4]|uniref:Uncharacterized protein n=1 Tax=Phytophthora infestans (strain T30-4) TaxID=403677 RepID=D0NI77_PHYIT|nr:uncharacterized protein PITG_11634 [Phytophthora infestans T30-4]EEY59162.1 hypothetical protein PITG_11634 [Phytophthora infestans T30-4]|eukprot:XP_002901176.1 hypothetical protein PITG_11634 [Phytophthora infestans T30-4]
MAFRAIFIFVYKLPGQCTNLALERGENSNIQWLQKVRAIGRQKDKLDTLLYCRVNHLSRIIICAAIQDQHERTFNCSSKKRSHSSNRPPFMKPEDY